VDTLSLTHLFIKKVAVGWTDAGNPTRCHTWDVGLPASAQIYQIKAY